MFGISNQFGVSVTELAKINNVSANTLQIGQELVIPSSSGTNPNNMFMYTVQNGDSLYKIARKYNTTVNEIVKLNNLKNTNLSIGQVLRIPEEYTKEEDMIKPIYINYTVKPGDNLYSIAKNNNVSIDVLMTDNGLTGPILKVGQNLKIRTTKEIEECFGPDYTPPSSTNEIIYIVKKGDSLYKIATIYNTSVDNIKRLNNLSTNSLSIGQQLKIPTSNEASNTYIVRSGDSLYSIAKKYNTSVDNIKNKNNLKTNMLQIGQKLII